MIGDGDRKRAISSICPHYMGQFFYFRTNNTHEKITRFWLTESSSSAIGPLHDPVTWYKIKYTGEQVAQWDL